MPKKCATGLKTLGSTKTEIPVPLEAQALDSLADPVLCLHENGEIALANTAAAEFFGRADLAGLPLDDFLPETAALGAALRQCLRAQGDFAAAGVPFGTDRSLSLKSRPCGGLRVILLRPDSIADRLETRRAQRQLLQPVETLAAQLAHEIKNPLAGIAGAAQLLEQSSANDEDAGLARLIKAEAARISRLVTRIDALAGDDTEEKQSLSLHEILADVLAAARAGFAAHVRIEQDYDPSLPAIDGSRDALTRLFMNLVKNAAEAAPAEGGVIRIRTYYSTEPVFHPDHGHKLPIAAAVENNGLEIPPDVLARIFTPFFTTKNEGSGLGLPIAARIAEDHGGLIRAASANGKTTVTLYLPKGTMT